MCVIDRILKFKKTVKLVVVGLTKVSYDWPDLLELFEYTLVIPKNAPFTFTLTLANLDDFRARQHSAVLIRRASR